MEERRRIIDLIADGAMTVDEGVRRLKALSSGGAGRADQRPGPGPEPFDWRAFLARLSEDALQDAQIRAALPPEVAASGWLGYAGATEPQLAEVETHLGVRLPPSYRAFLVASNGWRHPGPLLGRLWSTDEIEWLSVRNQNIIDIWSDYAAPRDGEILDEMALDEMALEARQMRTALEISEYWDGSILMLNPQVVAPDDEWEAWRYATWSPGIERYPSFRRLMEAEHDSLLDLMRV